MSKTTRKKYDPRLKTRVALEVYKGEKVPGQVASESGVAPSLAAEWRDQLLDEGAADVFGKAQRAREGKAREEAAKREHDELPGTIGQSAVERDLLRRSCGGCGHDPGEAPGGRRRPRRPHAQARLRAAGRRQEQRLLRARGQRQRGPRGRRAPDGREDRIHVDNPSYGAREVALVLRTEGLEASRWRVTRLMRAMSVRPCCPLPSPSRPSRASRRFPHLLRGKRADFPDQVWSTDIAYVQIGGRHMCPTAMADWHSRCIVGWRLSDTMREKEVMACAERAFAEHGTPSVTNSDQGSVFGSDAYVGLLGGNHVTQGMGGTGPAGGTTC
ncbi:DDE-type integrase/transposase/recombinase [Olsenella sp. Marseille-P4559]|uniref:DDE-type integrase/transposase/recombinase n=1 Tax=Olsenella sp. Marseille-P4559 TaxID=2364795 RepID=UPI0010300E95|nr:DDE-type integrase/transposase/recombinase [Olsenella sp. Marseille-P4559]